MPRLLRAAVLAVLVLAAPAQADTVTKTFRTGPITVDGYSVRQEFSPDVPNPGVEGAITAMDVDVVDADGTPVPIHRLMLHHIVFMNLGTTVGERRDATCSQFTMLDSTSKLPALAERFYAAGEERARMDLPAGYGYPIHHGEHWLLSWMLMNHRLSADKAYIQYRVTYTTDPVTPVTPWWLDVRNCLTDPVFDVPGGEAPGSTFSVSSDWAVPHDARIVAGGGHVHGGGKRLVLTEPDCGNRELAQSDPLWGLPTDPFYHVRPVLHEPGPISMSGFQSAAGIPVRAGEPLRLTADYDGSRPHTRSMGIMVVYAAPASGAPEACATVPPLTLLASHAPGRTEAPAFRVPIVGLDARGRAREISRPPGRTYRSRRGASVRVGGRRFSRPNLSVAAGSRVRWTFTGTELHDVTVANGPRGFSSPHLNAGHRYSKRLDTPGTYRLFCSLHPVEMTATIKVRRR